MTRGSFCPSSVCVGEKREANGQHVSSCARRPRERTGMLEMRKRQQSRGEHRYTYRRKGCGAKARPAIKPVVVAKLVDLDALLVRGLMRHLLCHHHRLGVRLRGERPVHGQVGGKFKMLLEGEFGYGSLVAQDGKRRHDSICLRPAEGAQRNTHTRLDSGAAPESLAGRQTDRERASAADVRQDAASWGGAERRSDGRRAAGQWGIDEDGRVATSDGLGCDVRVCWSSVAPRKMSPQGRTTGSGLSSRQGNGNERNRGAARDGVRSKQTAADSRAGETEARGWLVQDADVVDAGVAGRRSMM
jgi:hypothetical protein